MAKARAIEAETAAKLEIQRMEAEAAAQAAAAAELRKQADWSRTSGAIGAAKTLLILSVSLILSVGIGVAVAIGCIRLWHLSAAAKAKANLWAHLVQDAGGSPILITRTHIHALQTGAVLPLNEEAPGNEQQIAGAIFNHGLQIAASGAERIARATKVGHVAQAAGDAMSTVAGAQPAIRQLREGPLQREREALARAPIPAGIKSRLDKVLQGREEAIEGDVVED